jgi:hypothetical protein
MKQIKVSTADPLIPIERQTPGSEGVWDNCKFHINKKIDKCDWWFVLDTIKHEETCLCPRNNTVLITSESAAMKTYDQKYLNQFGYVITSQKNIKGPRVINDAQGHCWMIGHMGSYSGVDPKDYKKFFTPYDKIKGDTNIIKTKLRTPGQKLRLDFVDALKKHFGSNIDVFGVNEKFIADKWDGIAPYKYHIVLENSVTDDYWTEKLGDAFLASAYPLYWGAPNINKYFPTGSLRQIDLNNFERAIKQIEEAIGENLYEKNADLIKQSKDLVMNKYNVFAIMANLANQFPKALPAKQVRIYPEKIKKTFAQIAVEKLSKSPKIYKVVRAAYRKYRKI